MYKTWGNQHAVCTELGVTSRACLKHAQTIGQASRLPEEEINAGLKDLRGLNHNSMVRLSQGIVLRQRYPWQDNSTLPLRIGTVATVCLISNRYSIKNLEQHDFQLLPLLFNP
jgi:hypothetical protein